MWLRITSGRMMGKTWTWISGGAAMTLDYDFGYHNICAAPRTIWFGGSPFDQPGRRRADDRFR